jgi:hypothetical protein
VISAMMQVNTVRRWILAIAKLCVLASLIFPGAPACVAQNHRLTETASPDKSVVLATEKDADGAMHVFFVSATGEKLGSALSILSEGDLGNVNVLSSWNPSGSKVALLIYHGVRSSKIKLFARDDKNKFVPINVTLPDPLSIYGKPELRKLSEEHVSASENSLGPWTSDKSVRLVSGIMVDQGNSVFVHLFVTFTVILDGKANIQDVKLLGPYSDQDADEFLEHWGTKYWEEPDRESGDIS